MILGLQGAIWLGAGVTLVTACPPEQEEASAKVLQHAHELALARQLKTRAQLVHENAETAILQLAAESHADLIVMGAHPASTMATHLSPGTAAKVMIEATCPVMTMLEI